ERQRLGQLGGGRGYTGQRLGGRLEVVDGERRAGQGLALGGPERAGPRQLAQLAADLLGLGAVELGVARDRQRAPAPQLGERDALRQRLRERARRAGRLAGARAGADQRRRERLAQQRGLGGRAREALEGARRGLGVAAG